MRIANLITPAGKRAGILTDTGVCLVPENLARDVVSVIEGGAPLREKIEALDPKTLDAVPCPVFLPAAEKGKKLIMIGVNYREHAAECGQDPGAFPVVFAKFSNALAAHGEKIIPPRGDHKIDFEAELVVIIGKACKNVSPEEALGFVFGYTCGNDISARGMQARNPQWTTGKTPDGFAPCGPFVATADCVTPDNLDISCRVNGKLMQSANTSDMIFSVGNIISYLSSFMTLEPGDAIFTGTPPGVIVGRPESEQVWLRAGDVVRVEISGVGALENTVG